MSETYLTQTAVPLYQQLADLLRTAIDQGTYPPGSKLPTEHQLSQEYHVSRVTVRKALALLADQDEIERKTGNGTYVKERKLRRNLSSNVSSFTLMCKQMGTKASARTIRIAMESPSQEQKEVMHLAKNEEVLLVERVRYSNEEPVLIERDYFSGQFAFLFEEDLNHNSIYQIIQQRMGITFTNASRIIDIVFATAKEARELGLKTGYPLLRISSVTQSEDGSIVTTSEQLCVGDKFRLQV